MNSKRVVFICAILVFSILAVTGTVTLFKIQLSYASPGTHYVAPGGVCGPVGPCHGTIQEAVDVAVDGDIIKVAQGTYTSVLSNVVVITKGVSVLGGYSISDWQNADPAAQPSIIDGERSRRGVKIEGRNMPTITLQGITIQGGHGMTEGGGGINISSGTVIVQNCLITHSTTTLGAGAGGGIKIGGRFGEVFLIDNIIQNNNATGGGGVGVYNAKVTMIGNTLRDNAAFFGGGLEVDGDLAQVTMNGNKIIGSQAGGDQGSGIHIEGGVIDGQNDVIAQSFSGGGDGEAVFVEGGSLSARHWTLASNDSYGVKTAGSGSAILTNTIVASHTVAALHGAGVEAITSLFYGNSKDCVGGASCANSLSGDPRFTSPSTGDYHIMAGSAAVDAGIDAGVNTDIDGDIRPALLGFDIGADEIINWLYLPTVLMKG